MTPVVGVAVSSSIKYGQKSYLSNIQSFPKPAAAQKLCYFKFSTPVDGCKLCDSYQTKKQALANALKITKNGMADMVKLESTPKQINIVKYLIENKIKVCGHIGIQPQKIANKKLYRKIGTTAGEANELIREALLLQEAGAHILIAECIDGNCAKKIRNMLKIPLIGIGSGNNCDGQVRVIYDLFNISFNGSPGFMNNKRIKKNPFKDILIDYIKSTKKFVSN